MEKCYDKHKEFVVPHIYCSFCTHWIRPGETLYMVVVKWGDGRSACKECYDKYEIDWSMHETKGDDDELLELD